MAQITKKAPTAVVVGRVSLDNPIIVASGPLTDAFWKIEEAARHGAAAVSLKLTFVEVPFQSEMRSYSYPDNVIMTPTNKRLSIEEATELMRQVKSELDVRMFANYSALGAQMDYWKLQTERFLEAGTDMLEPNFCCPNLDTSKLTAAETHDHGGASIGENPDACFNIVSMMRSMTDVPIVPKIVPSSRHLMVLASQAIENAGAEGIHIVGFPISGLPPVEADGSPDMPLIEGVPQGSTNGSICRYSTYLATAQLAQAVRIPIIASGGLDTWRDCVDVIFWGASAASICSSIMWHGWEVIEQMNTGIRDFMERNGYGSIEEFRGMALRYFTTPDRIKLLEGHSVIDEELCIGCGRCTKPGHCNAIEMKDDVAVADKEKCIGCGLCRHLCPVGAISYEAATEESVPHGEAGGG